MSGPGNVPLACISHPYYADDGSDQREEETRQHRDDFQQKWNKFTPLLKIISYDHTGRTIKAELGEQPFEVNGVYTNALGMSDTSVADTRFTLRLFEKTVYYRKELETLGKREGPDSERYRNGLEKLVAKLASLREGAENEKFNYCCNIIEEWAMEGKGMKDMMCDTTLKTSTVISGRANDKLIEASSRSKERAAKKFAERVSKHVLDKKNVEVFKNMFKELHDKVETETAEKELKEVKTGRLSRCSASAIRSAASSLKRRAQEKVPKWVRAARLGKGKGEELHEGSSILLTNDDHDHASSSQ